MFHTNSATNSAAAGMVIPVLVGSSFPRLLLTNLTLYSLSRWPGGGPGCDLLDLESFLWDHVMFNCELDDSIETIDAFDSPLESYGTRVTA